MTTATIPNLKLFPLYTSGPILSGQKGLNGNSSFTIPATRFSPAYQVNMPPASNPFDPAAYLALSTDKNHRLVSKPTSGAPQYNTLLGINNTVSGHISKVAMPATAPKIPNLFQQAVSLYTISEANLSTLLAQPSFRIPTIGMGIKVTTDGNGNVQSVSLSPSSRGTINRANAVGHSLGAPNRAALTIAATYKVNDPGFSFGNVYAVEAPNGPPPAPAAKNLAANPLAALNPGPLGNSAGIFNTGPQSKPGLDGLNPVQARLNQLQPQNGGLAVSGADAGIGVDQAQQVAASQADYGVNLSSNFYQNITSLVSAAGRQQQSSYAATYAPPIDQVLDGRVNVMPWQAPTPVSQGAAAVGRTVSFNMGSAVADATAGNAGNSYLPFNMQSETSAGGGGFANPNPFATGGSLGGGSPGGMQSGMQQGSPQGGMASGGGSHAGNQKFPVYRKPLAYSA
jgi:hypothetical protein